METLYQNKTQTKSIDSLQANIIRALLYFDIFDYPLREEEIEEVISVGSPCTDSILEALHGLVSIQCIGSKEGFYFIGEERGRIQRRIKGNELASEKMETAKKYARLISRFPFVRAICISGSLSKGYMDKNSDIDYFVITEPGRLWLTRLLLTFYKKVFLLNSRKNFCINYFIDSHSLEIPDKNLFTATELVYIIPVYNYNLYKKVMENNAWRAAYYPNYPLQESREVLPETRQSAKAGLEKVFRFKTGDILDAWAFKFLTSYLKKKYKLVPSYEHEVNHRAKKNASKHHPLGFQWKVLAKHDERIKGYELEHGILLNATEN